MNQLLVFDPAQCCSTGVCGAEVDPVLVRFAADLNWLTERGAQVQRFNLAQEAAAFAQNPLVRRTLQQEGTECLPLVLRGGEIVSRGRYPGRDELASWGGVASHESVSPRPAAGEGSAKPAEDPCCGPTVVSLGSGLASGRGSTGCC